MANVKPPMGSPHRILVFGREPDSARPLLDELGRAACVPEWRALAGGEDFRAHLDPVPELIVVAPNLTELDALVMLEGLRVREMDIPLLFVAEKPELESAVALLKYGAADYVTLKELSRLPAAMSQAHERQRQREERSGRQFEALLAVTSAPPSYLAPDQSLHELLDRACAVLVAQFAVLLVIGEEGRHLSLRAARGLEVEAGAELQVSAKEGIPGQIMAQRQPVLLTGLSPDIAQSPVLAAGTQSILGVPLLAEGEVIGVMLVGRRADLRFTNEDARLLQFAADRATRVIEHARLFEQVRAGRERSQILSQQLMEAQEAERRHLARELHDEIGQALTAVKINLQAMQRTATEAPLLSRLEESVGIVDRALQQVRNLSLDLRPSLLDDLGLVAALRWYIDRQAQRGGLAAEFVTDPPGLRAPTTLETTCFRVTQEALTNVLRHAKARKVRVELRQSDVELQLRICDDGSGFDVAAARRRAARGGSLGLLGMQERVVLIGGRIDIQSAPGRGSEIDVRFPLASLPAVERRRKRRDSR
jgi:signal transduction histidine kinase